MPTLPASSIRSASTPLVLNVISFAARTTIDGLVDGEVTATGGEIELGGSVGGTSFV